MEVDTFFICFVLFFLKNCVCQDICESKDTCSECIQSIGCAWCITPLDSSQTRCKNESISGGKNWCPELQQVSPKRSVIVLSDIELSNGDHGDAIQIKPQRIKLSLRKGEEYKLKFKYRQAENYPIDLYYLMDLSTSMRLHKNKLGELGTQLANTMKNITNNFRLGFGSFVDKVALPFTNTAPDKLKDPCASESDNCVPPYSFINHMALTENSDQFAKEVINARVSGNIDAPEGGFDALMQAIVCKKEIGWREQARRLLVYSSDSDFHIAGDGKLAGVVEPNDAKCHMTNNKYDSYLQYDYPSISQINYVAKENNINLIFAIVLKDKSNVINIYKTLSDHIENSNVGGLKSDSTNVINLVLDNYKKISNSVTLTSNADNDVDIKFSSTCSNNTDNGRKCLNTRIGEEIDFEAIIKPLECVPNTKIISIKPEGLNDSIIIELEVKCECDCAHSSSPFYVNNSTKCKGFGNLECGVCKCHEGYTGKNCECDKAKLQFHADDKSSCENNNGIVCSGAGMCLCGKCECDKRSIEGEKIYGNQCQCNNYSCKRDKGNICSKNGECECGKCKCKPGWTGDACECADDNACIAPRGDKICSGRGKCKCGKCICDDEYSYFGDFCEKCATCNRCEDWTESVECCMSNKNQPCSINCTSFIFEEKIEDEKRCILLDKNKCYLYFLHEYDDNNEMVIKIEKKKVCPTPFNVIAWTCGVIACVILIGIVTLIVWKIITSIHDRREYEKFERERDNMRWHQNDNPLYKNASSTFKNPAYNRKSRFSFHNKPT